MKKVLYRQKVLISLFLIMTMLMSNVFSLSADNTVTLSDLNLKGTAHWAKAHINQLVDRGIIAGYPDGTFKPDNTVETDAFIKMVVCALGYSFENGLDYWALPYINKAKDLKLIDGTEFNTYRRAITREEAAKVIVNALATLEELPKDEQINKYITKVPDYSKIGTSYKKVALHAYATGLITGDPKGAFNPKNNLSRAEAATVIMRLLDASLRKPINIDEQLSNTLPELLKSDEEVWGRENIRDFTSLEEYDLKDGKLYYKNEPDWKNVLPKEILNPDINRQIHDVIKVLMDDEVYVRSFYRPGDEQLKSQTSVLLSKDSGYAYNGVAFFAYGFADEKPYRLSDSFPNKALSNNATIQLEINNLWWYYNEDGSEYNPIQKGWSVPYYAEKLKKSCMALFGSDIGNKVYKYVHGIYMDERLMMNSQNQHFRTEIIDNIQIDYYNNGAELHFYFTIK
jgi:hypothetical protein